VGEQLGVCRHTVRTWRQRFAQNRLTGLSDAPKSGTPQSIQDQNVEKLIQLTLESVPGHAT
jgi:transposase-like protein